MNRHITTPATLLRTVVVVLAFIMALVATATTLAVISTRHAGAADGPATSATGTILTIYDRGTERVIVTHAHTIGDALDEAGISLAKEDVVQPSADQVLVAHEYQVNIYRARPVIVIDGNVREKVMTAYQTADQIAAQVGITLYPEDTTSISLSDDIVSDGASLELTITRAKLFHLTLYGSESDVRSQGPTVGDMLKAKNITLGPNDRVSPDLSTPITAGMSVNVWREGVQTTTDTETVPFTTQKIDDANEPVGYDEVQTPGVNGSQKVTYQIDIRNGQEVSRTQIANIVTQQPTTQVEVVGTYLPLSAGYSADRVSIMDQAGIAPSDQGYAAYIVDHEDASWCPTRWQGSNTCLSIFVEPYVGAAGAGIGYGLCQATPGDKMAAAGSDWETNPVTQMKWCSSYAVGRYGSWAAAYNFKVANGWW